MMALDWLYVDIRNPRFNTKCIGINIEYGDKATCLKHKCHVMRKAMFQ